MFLVTKAGWPRVVNRNDAYPSALLALCLHNKVDALMSEAAGDMSSYPGVKPENGQYCCVADAQVK